MLAFIAKHQSLTAVRAIRLISEHLYVPAHLDFSFAVRAKFCDEAASVVPLRFKKFQKFLCVLLTFRKFIPPALAVIVVVFDAVPLVNVIIAESAVARRKGFVQQFNAALVQRLEPSVVVALVILTAIERAIVKCFLALDNIFAIIELFAVNRQLIVYALAFLLERRTVIGYPTPFLSEP